jgi:hypothetical protein
MTGNDRTPDGYRQSVTTAITVFLGFSLTFLRTFWGIKARGGWSLMEVASESIIAAGVILQVVTLFRALKISDDRAEHYRTTMKFFRAGVIVVIAGVLLSVF